MMQQQAKNAWSIVMMTTQNAEPSQCRAQGAPQVRCRPGKEHRVSLKLTTSHLTLPVRDLTLSPRK